MIDRARQDCLRVQLRVSNKPFLDRNGFLVETLIFVGLRVASPRLELEVIPGESPWSVLKVIPRESPRSVLEVIPGESP